MLSKKAEIEEERRKADEFKLAFKAKAANQITQIFLKLDFLREKLESTKLSELIKVGKFEELETYTDKEPLYLRNIDSKILRRILNLESGLNHLNFAISVTRMQAEIDADYVYQREDNPSFIQMIEKGIILSGNIIRELDPESYDQMRMHERHKR